MGADRSSAGGRCARVLAACAFVASLAAGCDGCRKEKPYTPFAVTSSLPSAEAEPSAEAPTGDAGAVAPTFAARPATPAPKGATRWSFAGRALDAPPGRAFERALGADFDGNGETEIVAWTEPTAGAGPGELWLYPAAGAPKKLHELAGFVPSGPACRHEVYLVQTGPRSVTLDVTAKCTAQLLPRAPVRALAVLAPIAERPAVLTLRLAAPARGEPFLVEVDSTDRDQDGRDDVRVVVTQRPTCRPARPDAECVPDPAQRPVSAQLLWFDRAAGPSRDPSEPSASLARLAAAELSRSKRKKSGATVSEGVRSLRRLMGTLCAEGGVPRLLDADGNPIRCEPLAVVVDRLLAAEVNAALADDDWLGAVSGLDHDGWYFARASTKQRAEVEKAVLAKVVVVEATPKPLAARPVPRGEAPRWSPLAYQPDGSLWVQTGAGVAVIGPTGEERAAEPDAGVAAWPLPITLGANDKLGRVALSCDGSSVAIDLAGANPARSSLGDGLLAPRPGACGGGRAPTVQLTPLAVAGGKAALLLGGVSVGDLSAGEAALRPRVLGSALSPDGRWRAVPTTLGVLVTGPSKAELWRPKSADAARLSECVIADGGSAVACVDGSAAVVLGR